MPQAFLAWDTSHVFSVGSCYDDHCQPRRCGQSCASGCTSPVLWHSVCADSSPGVRRRRTLPSLCHSLRTVRRAGARRERTSLLSCKASCGQPIPKSVAATPPVIPCVRTAAPWIRRRRTPPSSCHSLRADNRARASSRTHLRPRARPPRVQTAHLTVHPRAPGHPHPPGRHLRRGHSTRPGASRPGRGHSTPSGTAIPSPNASPVPDRTEMSPHAQDVPSRDARVWGIHGIPSHWCASCTSTDLQPRPPGPTQAPEATRQGKVRALPGTPESGRPAPPTLTGRGGSPLSQQPSAFGEDRQVHPVTGTDPLLRTAQVGLDG